MAVINTHLANKKKHHIKCGVTNVTIQQSAVKSSANFPINASPRLGPKRSKKTTGKQFPQILSWKMLEGFHPFCFLGWEL